MAANFAEIVFKNPAKSEKLWEIGLKKESEGLIIVLTYIHFTFNTFHDKVEGIPFQTPEVRRNRMQ